MVSARNITTHQKTKKCKNYNDKTAGKQSVITSQAAEQVAAAPAESSKLKIVSLKQEYDKNMEKLNPVKKNDKAKKYQCGACGCMFDNLNDGKCPDCGEQLQ